MRGGLLMIRTKRSSKAATLIELIIVLVLAGVIVAAVIGYFALARTSAQVSGMVAAIGTIETQLMGMTNGGRSTAAVNLQNASNAAGGRLSNAVFPAYSPSANDEVFALQSGVLPQVRVGGFGTSEETTAEVVMVAHTSTQVGSPTAGTPGTPAKHTRNGNVEFIYGQIDADVCDRVARNMSGQAEPSHALVVAQTIPLSTFPAGTRTYIGATDTGISVSCDSTTGTSNMYVTFHEIGASGEESY